MEKNSNGKADLYFAPQTSLIVPLVKEPFCGSAYSIPKLEEGEFYFNWE